ncbi:hypothetical protein AVEN_262595-1 [Araneus ventricosus]|uniref:Uncharacterized protein n=1 Tax=Araneus ventricosus TaxID=182803 RepID=A0A4Y2HIE0_ARAVE|nr:hypothetical protein AVEN_262595-1 [Araneus ventricosus]
MERFKSLPQVMTPFEVLRVSCGYTETGTVDRECNLRICCACLREATSTSKSPDRISFVDVTTPTLPVMAFCTRKGETLPKFSSVSVLRFMMKNASKFSVDCPLKQGL